MRQINTLISKRINRSVGRINHVFGGRYHWSLVTEKNYYKNVIKYVYQNPLRANLCSNVEDYPYSTLHHVIFKSYALELETFLTDYDLNWLNKAYNKDQRESLQKGKRRKIFRPSKCRRKRKEIQL